MEYMQVPQLLMSLKLCIQELVEFIGCLWDQWVYESGESNGKISIEELFNNPNIDIDGIKSDLTIEDLIFAACRGGWPDSINKKK